MKKFVILLGTILLFATVGLTTSAGTAVSAKPISAVPQSTQEKPLNEVEVAASTPSADDPITGEWDASVEAGGQTMHIALHLKLEGDNVTGSLESQFGSATISKGNWDGNKLTFSLDSPNGSINMNAVLKEGKLVGEYDYAGQLTGKWEAKKE
jgi:hypothetical protein